MEQGAGEGMRSLSSMKSLTIVMAQFGTRHSSVEPSLSSFRRFFPEARVVLYSDVVQELSGVEVKVVEPPYAKDDPRYGNRSNDLYKGVGLLVSETDVAIAIDSDMKIVSPDVRAIISLIDRFGLCVPSNERLTVMRDATKGVDGGPVEDDSLGLAYAMNMSPVGLSLSDQRAVEVVRAYVNEMEKAPVRGPLAMWKAIWRSAFYPCLLPLQWCVCVGSCGIGDEVILHTGHEAVVRHYEGSLEQVAKGNGKIAVVTGADGVLRSLVETSDCLSRKLGYDSLVYDLGGLGFGKRFRVDKKDFIGVERMRSGMLTIPPTTFKPSLIRRAMDDCDSSRFVWLDGDAMIVSPIDEVFAVDFDVAVTMRRKSEGKSGPNAMVTGYVNAGVIFLRQSKKVRGFLDKWEKEAVSCGNDQLALNRLLNLYEHFDHHGRTIAEQGLRVRILDTDTYNNYYFNEGVQSDAKVWHFKGAVRDHFSSMRETLEVHRK